MNDAMPTPAANPIAVETTPTIERSDGHTHDHLAPRGADRPHQGGLPSALSDEDRERVVDAERRDDHRDAGEHEQDRPEHPEEVAVDVLLLLGREVGTGNRLHAVGQAAGDAALELGGADAVGAPHEHG